MIIRKRGKELPPPPSGIKRVKSMVILGITITDDLRASKHVDSVIASCSQSMYALRVLKAHGLPAADSIQSPGPPLSPDCYMPPLRGGALPQKKTELVWTNYIMRIRGANHFLK